MDKICFKTEVMYLFGLECCCASVFIIGITLGVVFFVSLGSKKIKEDEIVEVWSTVIAGQAKERDSFFQAVIEEKQTTETPFAENYIKHADSMGDTPEDYLKITFNNDVSAYIGTIIQGKELYVSWSLRDRDILEKLLRIPILGFILGIFLSKSRFNRMHRIRSFATITKDCAQMAAEKILKKAGLDPEKMNRKTSGRLGPL